MLINIIQYLTYTDPFLIKKEKSYNRDHTHTRHIKIGGRGTFCMKNRQASPASFQKKKLKPNKRVNIYRCKLHHK